MALARKKLILLFQDDCPRTKLLSSYVGNCTRYMNTSGILIMRTYVFIWDLYVRGLLIHSCCWTHLLACFMEGKTLEPSTLLISCT